MRRAVVKEKLKQNLPGLCSSTGSSLGQLRLVNALLLHIASVQGLLFCEALCVRHLSSVGGGLSVVTTWHAGRSTHIHTPHETPHHCNAFAHHHTLKKNKNTKSVGGWGCAQAQGREEEGCMCVVHSHYMPRGAVRTLPRPSRRRARTHSCGGEPCSPCAGLGASTQTVSGAHHAQNERHIHPVRLRARTTTTCSPLNHNIFLWQ